MFKRNWKVIVWGTAGVAMALNFVQLGIPYFVAGHPLEILIGILLCIAGIFMVPAFIVVGAIVKDSGEIR